MIPVSSVISLLFLGGIALWLLVESGIHYVFKIVVTSMFCLFTMGVFYSLSTFLGWSALERDAPEDVAIVAVQIKEPNRFSKTQGGIYLLLDSIKSKYDSKFLNMFGYTNDKKEPRLFRYPYSRELHEQLEKEVIPALKDGQVVRGKLKKGKPGEGKGKGKGDPNGKGDKEGYDGSNSEGLYEFHKLIPGEVNPKYSNQ
jgi:hypothetical protein